MTFEEAREQLNELFIEPNPPGFSIGDFAPELIGSVEDLEEIFDRLQETYAPKIKMTFEQKDELMQFLDESADFGFENFWICLGSGSNLYKGFTENELMYAWLHPELIEVVFEK